MNLYGFVGNNAITGFDLLGLLDENGMALLNDLNAKMALLVRQRALLESERSTRLLKNLGSACYRTKVAIDKARDVFYTSENDISYAYHVLKAREYQVNLCDTSSLKTAEDLEYSAGRIADWIQEQFELTNEILSGDGQSVLQNWVVNVYTDIASNTFDPLRLGSSAGSVSGSPITFGSIALATTQETLRLANIAALGSAAYLKGSSFLKDPILSGHGGVVVGNSPPITIVPRGTTVNFWTEHGKPISDALENAIETGAPVTLDLFPEEVGASSYLPGSVVPNYTLLPPVGLNIMGNPITVTTPTSLSTLLKPRMGNVNWAACRSIITE